MKNPYTKEKIQSIYAGIPDAKLEKTKKNYTIWGIICIVLIYFIPIGAFLLWRTWLISQELRNRTIEKCNVADPLRVSQKANTHAPDEISFSFSDGTVIYLDDIFTSDFDIVKTYQTKVVGVSFKNENGTSRQAFLEYAYPGEALAFKEFDYYGDPAYAVFTKHSEEIGRIKKELAADIHDFIESDERELIMYGKIKDITGGEEEGQENYGCNITVYLLARK